MRKKLIGFIILILALSLLTIGIVNTQYALTNALYEQMILVP